MNNDIIKATPEQQQINIAIALFMGIQIDIDPSYSYPPDNSERAYRRVRLAGYFVSTGWVGTKAYILNNLPLEYHANWQWLMPVGQKIFDILGKIHKNIPQHSCVQGDLIEVDITCHIREYNIGKAHEAIGKWLEWYNEEQEKIQQWLSPGGQEKQQAASGVPAWLRARIIEDAEAARKDVAKEYRSSEELFSNSDMAFLYKEGFTDGAEHAIINPGRYMLAGSWIPIGSNTDLPPSDSNDDFPRQYILRCKGDDPRSGWVAVLFRTADQMRYTASQYEYVEYLSESVTSEEVPALKALIAALKTAREALACCYDVDTYPADGSTMQDRAIKVIDSALKLC